jgi:hypothetical protein
MQRMQVAAGSRGTAMPKAILDRRERRARAFHRRCKRVARRVDFGCSQVCCTDIGDGLDRDLLTSVARAERNEEWIIVSHPSGVCYADVVKHRAGDAAGQHVMHRFPALGMCCHDDARGRWAISLARRPVVSKSARMQ